MNAAITLACTVCYGDPGSPLTEGAKAGVIVLGVAILCVLLAFGGLFLFWMRRAKALERELAAAKENADRIDVPVSGAPAVAMRDESASPSLSLH